MKNFGRLLAVSREELAICGRESALSAINRPHFANDGLKSIRPQSTRPLRFSAHHSESQLFGMVFSCIWPTIECSGGQLLIRVTVDMIDLLLQCCHTVTHEPGFSSDFSSLKPKTVRLPKTWRHVVRNGDVAVKIYKNKDHVRGENFPTFLVSYYASGKRQLRRFVDFGKASAEATRIAQQKAEGALGAPRWARRLDVQSDVASFLIVRS
ncbi:MAG TPA: hypothetical protein VG938_07890 [Verrucomicrobiae bacterium]|jgi:hypothetical protein|nr:hypothetical protein [Verrucomicrobiae bacterium]